MNNQKFSKNITSNILMRYIISLAIYFGTVSLFFIVSKLLFSLFIWQGDEFIYQTFKIIDKNKEIILILVFSVGFIGISIYFFRRVLAFLEVILSSMDSVYNEKDSFVHLPSELKEAENQMNQIKLNMNGSRQAAREAEKRKNDLIVYLAHDLKTPLTSVIGYLTLLRDETQISDGLREKYLSISLDKAERLEDLINEFFEITRFNLSSIVLEYSRVNLTRMLEQLIYEFKPMFSEKQLTCTLDANPDIFISCDIDKMQRVFDNLLRNAVNYSFDNHDIKITVTQSCENITLDFTNHGNTIPKEKLSRIFEQFYRLDSARMSSSGNAGLGLAIAKQIVELHDGTIGAYSEDEVINFKITMPIK